MNLFPKKIKFLLCISNLLASRLQSAKKIKTEPCFSLATSPIILQDGHWQAPFTLIVLKYILYSLNQWTQEVHTHPFFHRTRRYPAKTYGQTHKQNSNNTGGVVWMHSSFGTRGTILNLCSKDNCSLNLP